MRARPSSWFIFKQQAEKDGRLDGKLNIPGEDWPEGRTPALESWRARAQAVQSQIGADWHALNARHEAKALEAQRRIGAAERDRKQAEARVAATDRRKAALDQEHDRPKPRRIDARGPYWALLVVSIFGELPLMTGALQVLPDRQQAIWVMAVCFGALLFAAAHVTGAAVWRALDDATGRRRGGVALGIVLGATAFLFLLTLGLMRASYLVQVQSELDLGVQLAPHHALWPFVLMQVLLFVSASAASYFRHDYLAAPEIELARSRRRAERELTVARRRELEAEQQLDKAIVERDNAFGQKLDEAAVQRFLDEVLMWRYRTENLRSRQQPVPAAFATHPVPQIETAAWMLRDRNLGRFDAQRPPAPPPPRPHRPTARRTSTARRGGNR